MPVQLTYRIAPTTRTVAVVTTTQVLLLRRFSIDFRDVNAGQSRSKKP